MRATVHLGRYTVTSDPKCVSKEKRDAGLPFEIIDRTHPSDGGPVAISWHATEGEALERIRWLKGDSSD